MRMRHIILSFVVCLTVPYIIIFIYCNWVVTRWQWLFYMHTKHEIGFFLIWDSKHLNVLRRMARGNPQIQFALSFSVCPIATDLQAGRHLSTQFILHPHVVLFSFRPLTRHQKVSTSCLHHSLPQQPPYQRLLKLQKFPHSTCALAHKLTSAPTRIWQPH